MIYLSDCPRYTNIVWRSSAIGFIELTTSSSSSTEPLKSYIDERHLRRCEVKVFLVETEVMAWYMGVFAATPEQCSNAYQQKHLWPAEPHFWLLVQSGHGGGDSVGWTAEPH
jgi:hypothetical protein